jgi:hypothetical protein
MDFVGKLDEKHEAKLFFDCLPRLTMGSPYRLFLDIRFHDLVVT